MDQSELDQLRDEVCRLARAAAHPSRGTLAVSPEAAAYLIDEPSPLEQLEREVRACRKCLLCETRNNTVFGSGDPGARLVFVGEAPGAQEDAQGLPFVGKAGKLLTDIIEKGIGIPRGRVYICNVLKCRPPENRDPRPDEVEQCEPYLARQLELIRPQVICALGRHAAHALLKITESTGRMRGRWHFYRDIPVRVTYHPSYIVRLEDDPARLRAEKKKVWEDIQEVIRVLKGEVAPKPDATSRGTGDDLFAP